jgi:Coenzyme PQQ synthesis protein D (PqqD)
MDQPEDNGARWQRIPGVVTCVAGDEVSLLVKERWDSVALDEVSHRVWQLLAVPRTLDELVVALGREYEVSEDRCRADLEPLLTTLAEAGALQRSG